MKQAKISVVIPVYNSEKSIEELTHRLAAVLQERFFFEIILVNDFSKDRSREVIDALEEDITQVKVYHAKENMGQQAALKKGIELSSGDFVATMDDDLQHRPEDLLRLKEVMDGEGYDVVYGVSKEKSYSFLRKLGSKSVDLFFTLFFNKPHAVKVSSFRLLNRKTADAIARSKGSFVYLTAIILETTKKIGNITIEYQERKYGKSNYTLKKLVVLFAKLTYYYRIRKLFSTREDV